MALPLLALGALAKLAPGVIRAAGEFLGGNAKTAAHVIADAVDGGEDIEAAAAAMPPEVQVELARVANEAQALQNEREARVLQHDETLHSETQQTARSEQAHGTKFVKETRPKIARNSFNYGTLFAFVLLLVEMLTPNSGANEFTLFILGLIYGPCFQYIGVRTIDKWKGKPGTTV
jgi:hypothetical protein